MRRRYAPWLAVACAVAATHLGVGTAAALGEGYWHTDGAKLRDAAGNEVRIAGVNWSGFETLTYVVHGLWIRNWKEMLAQIAALGYNALRLPISGALFSCFACAYSCAGPAPARPNGIDYTLNPDLRGLTALQVLDKVVAECRRLGLKVILDYHSNAPRNPNAPPNPFGGGLWYDTVHPESYWLDRLRLMAKHYRNNDTVLGVDLVNEPSAATWGDGNLATDWRLAAERGGNALLAENPDLLVFVQGVTSYHGYYGWDGSLLIGARDYPVRLDVANRLVYSAHDYSENVSLQPWFNDPTFPANLPALWDVRWGYLVKEGIAPVWIGEFGTALLNETDRLWLLMLREYLETNGVSFTYWTWNADSGDTGGLLTSDWRTINEEQNSVLTTLLFPLDAPTDVPGDDPAATPALIEPSCGIVGLEPLLVVGVLWLWRRRRRRQVAHTLANRRAPP